jgi:hypothetical protein
MHRSDTSGIRKDDTGSTYLSIYPNNLGSKTNHHENYTKYQKTTKNSNTKTKYVFGLCTKAL